MLPRIRNRHIVATVLAVAALLIPFSIAPGSGPAINEACAFDACCPEIGSICSGASFNYYTTMGETCFWPTSAPSQP